MLGAVMPEPVAWWLILEVMGAIAFPIVYVGDFERETYSKTGLAKFGEMGEIVFRQDKVTIYEVSREEEAASER